MAIEAFTQWNSLEEVVDDLGSNIESGLLSTIHESASSDDHINYSDLSIDDFEVVL